MKKQQPRNHTSGLNYRKSKLVSDNFGKVSKINSLLNALNQLLSHSKSLVLNIVAVATGVLVLSLPFSELASRKIFIRPIQVPESLAKAGYTSIVLSELVSVKLDQMNQIARTKHDKSSISTEPDSLKVQSPVVGFDYISAINFIKYMLGVKDIVVSSMVTMSDQGFDVRININNPMSQNRYRFIPVKSKDVDLIVNQTAKTIFELTQPYVYGTYLIAEEKKACLSLGLYPCPYEESLAYLHSLVSSGSDKDIKKWAYNGLGHIHFVNRNYSQAINYYKEAIRVDPDFYLAHQNLGTTYLMMGSLKKCIVEYEFALENIKDDKELIYNYALALSKMDRVEDAIKHYQSLTKMDGQYKLAFYNLGVIFLKRGACPDAVRNFSQVLKIDSTYQAAINNMISAGKCKGR